MADQITWQNINAPDLAAASRPLEAAQRSFSGVFDQLGGILAQYQQTGEKNWQNTKTNNTNAFLDRLASYKTPEELAAAQASGELGRFRSGFGAQVDSNILRGAEEQRINALRTGVKQAGEYQDWSTDQSQAPIKDQIKSLVAAGKFDEAQGLLNQHELRNESELAMGLRNMKRQVTTEGQQDTVFSNGQTRFKWDTEMQPLNMQAKRADIAQSGQSVLESKARIQNMGTEAELRREQIEATKEARMFAKGGGQQDKAYAEAVSNSPYSAGSFDTAAGKKALMEYAKTVPGMDPADVSDLVYNLNKYYKDGVTIGMGKDGKPIKAPLPINVIQDALNESSDNFLAIGFSRRGDDVANIIDRRFGINSDGYQRSDKMAKADMATIQGMQFIKSLEAKRLERLNPKATGGGPNELSGTAAIGTERKLKDNSTYKYTDKGWVRMW